MMGPTRKSRSVNKRYVNEDPPSKEGESAKRSHSRKRKLSDMLGPRWTMDELTRFYDAYRKHGKDWKKVSGAVKNRSSEMVEALYTMNRAYLSLPHGTASAAGLIAMMTDHYSNMAGSDSGQNSDDGAGSSRKAQRHSRGKVQPTPSKATDEQFVLQSQTGTSNYGCLPLLTKKRSKGSRPCPVGKRTPRFPVSLSHENNNRERYFSPTKKALQLKADANDDEVAHEIAIALAEALQRGSPQISLTPSKKADSVMSSPFRHAQKKHSLAEMGNTKHLDSDMDEEYLEGSTEADTGELSDKPTMVESSKVEMVRRRQRKLEGNKPEDDDTSENHLGDVKEECSGTDEGQRLDATADMIDTEVTHDKVSKSSMQSQRTKSKEVLLERDETATFDALQTLADLSLMMPTENEDELRMQFKTEDHDHVDESASFQAPNINQQKEKRRYIRVRKKGVPSSQIVSHKQSKPGKDSAFDVSHVPEENWDLSKSMAKTRKKQRKQLCKIQKAEVQPDMHLSDSPAVEMEDAGKKLMTKSKKSAQKSSPNLMKKSENSSSADLRKEGSDSAQSAVQVTVSNKVNITPKVNNRRKIDLKKSPVLNDLKLPDKELNDQSNLQLSSLNERVFHLKEKLSNCLLNPQLRRWCTYELFYSSIDYPWFGKREFVEYLDHVRLGHVSKLTRAEWGVIRSSLGKPRRFSEQFLKEEKEKLNQYRDSVRKHYTELREGVREGLPTDLARPLSVGQRVIAIHPKTRDIHDGSVLTVDHCRCRVQFDCHELGVEFVLDIDCMPLNPSENVPASHGRPSNAVDNFFEHFYELKLNGPAQEFLKLYPADNVDSSDGIPQLSQLTTDPTCSIKQTKVVSVNTNVQTGIGSAENASYQQTPYFEPGNLAQVQAKEADVKALAVLTRALDKKEAVVVELRRMNDDMLENQRDGDNSLKDSEPFKKQYAALLVQLNEINEQVSSALQRLRQRNTYHGNAPLAWFRPVNSPADLGGELSSSDHAACESHESGSHANEIIDSSRAKARAMVAAAIQALSSLESKEDTSGKIEETVDYVNGRLPTENSMPLPPDHKPTTPSNMDTQIPSNLISKCVATLIMIQKCTERQLPPSDMAKILDSAVTSLQPRCPQNLPIYSEIQKCMGIIRNQIMAKIPT